MSILSVCVLPRDLIEMVVGMILICVLATLDDYQASFMADLSP